MASLRLSVVRLTTNLLQGTLSRNLLVVLSLFFILFGISLGFFIHDINAIWKLHARIMEENVTSIQAAYNVEVALLNFRGLKSFYLLDHKKDWIYRFESNVNEFNYWYNRAYETAKTDKEKQILSRISILMEGYYQQHRQFVKNIDRGDVGIARQLLLGDNNSLFQELYQGCEELITKNESLIDSVRSDARRIQNRAIWVGWLAIFLFCALSVLLVVYFYRRVLLPLREIESSSDNQLGRRLKHKNNPDEIRRIRSRFEMMAAELRSNQMRLIESERRAAMAGVMAGISHEINNPLGVIFGFSERLSKDARLSTEQRKMINHIHREASRCKVLLADILSGFRSGPPMMERLNPAQSVNDVVALLSKQENYRGIHFRLGATQPELSVRTDRGKLRQIIVNLLKNAREHIGEKPRISIDFRKTNKAVEIIISDNGPGISPHNRKKIFQPFFSTRQGGTGLGLSISLELAKQLGGDLKLSKSKARRGACFILTLPRAKEES